MNVGIRDSPARANKVAKCSVFKPIVSIYFKVWPVCIRMKFIGISPNIDATRKYL